MPRQPPAIALLALLALAPGAAAQTIYQAFGDSITVGVLDDPARTRPGYPPRLEAILANHGVEAVVENRGLSSETTAEGVTRIDRVLEDGGDVLLLMEGTNDIGQLSRETTIFNLDQMARKAENAGLEAVHATIIPRGPFARKDADNVNTRALAQEIRLLALDRGRRLVDPFELFGATEPLWDELFAQAPGDTVGHPDAAGYDVLARGFADVLLGIDGVPPVEASLRPLDGAEGISPNVRMEVELLDFGEGIDTAASTLRVDGVEVDTAVTGDAGRAVLSHQLSDRPDGPVELGVRSPDLADPANTLDRTLLTFFVGAAPDEPTDDDGTLVGDVDSSGRVDGVDLVALALRFGSARGDGRYDDRFDFDGDGAVDGVDLAMLADNFGRSAD